MEGGQSHGEWRHMKEPLDGCCLLGQCQAGLHWEGWRNYDGRKMGGEGVDLVSGKGG